ncbi:Citrate synthase 1 [Alphaproteobacteria bacterium SO-S41]|nr:Citrate synthase 1 [Alphaproteobacteria bacterium SO-S41]
MNVQVTQPAIGLDGIPAAITALSLVDGLKGELIIAGAAVEALAKTHSFEETAIQLWQIADSAAAAVEAAQFGAFRVSAFAQAQTICPSLTHLAPIDGLRAGIAALDIPDGPDAALAITAALPVLVMTLEALRAGKTPLAPDPTLSHAADTLRQLRGTAPSEAEAKALGAYLTTVSDHGMNASTFACRVIIATRASLVSAVTGAYAALSGPLHGGAPGPVLDMLDEIGGEQNIAPWIAEALEGGGRLMGFGHRIYRTRDPRADVLKAALGELAPSNPRLDFALKVEREAQAQLAARHPGRKLDTNVEFYTALLLDALGIPRTLFTPMFAIGRVAGWTAHAIEHHARRGRLIRPEAIYDGARP